MSTFFRWATGAGLAALLVGAFLWRSSPGEALDEAELRPVLEDLLAQVYTAFGKADEFAIYDGIAAAVAEDIAAPLYLQRRAAQLLEEEAGAATELLALDLLEAQPLPPVPGGQPVSARWRVEGRVGHGDHQHIRSNLYAARLTIAKMDGAWKFTGFDLDSVAREEEEPVFFEGFE